MGTEAEETAAIEALDGAEWMGSLKVNGLSPRRTEVRLVGEGETVVGILSTTKLSAQNCSQILRADFLSALLKAK